MTTRLFHYILNNIRQHKYTILLVMILLLSFWLRVRGIDFGLPNLYHPDEDAVLMPALSILKTGNFDPIRMDYGTLQIYLLTAVSMVVFALSARNGQIQDTSQLPIFERGSYPAIYSFPDYFMAGRMLSAIMGAGIVLLTYALAQRLGNRRQGLIVATIVAILPTMVAKSHYITTDIPVTFWIMLSLYLLIRAYDQWQTDTLWAYIGAGFVCGLAMSTKYNAFILIVPLFITPLFLVRNLDKWLSLRVLGGFIAMVVGFLFGTPYALLNIPKFLHWFGYSLHLYNAPRDLPIPVWQWHLNYHLASPHASIFILGIVGFTLSFFQWGKRALIINSFAVVLWIAILSQTNAQARMWIPSAPIFAMWATLTIDWSITKIAEILPLARQYKTLTYVPLLILLPLLITSLQYGTQFQEDDARTTAQQWIETNVPSGTAVAVDYMPPNLDTETWSITRLFFLFDKDIDWFIENDIEYLVMNTALNDFSKLSPSAYGRYQKIIANTCLIKTIQEPILSSTEFSIEIYHMGVCQ